MELGSELEGMLVVSLEQAVAAPYCSLLLADAGARVIKLERPEGDFARRYDTGADGESVWFAWLNRGKESAVLDFKRESDAALMRRMLARADVFLHNLAPGAAERNGFDARAVRALNARLINCRITGYGEGGGAAALKAYDFLVQAESGVCAVTGTPDEPARVGISIADLGTGLTAFSAILRALFLRSRTGRGVDLSISMFDVMADWMNMPLLADRHLPVKPVRSGLRHAMVAPYGAFACREGKVILIAIQNDREWRAFCHEVLERPELAADRRFADNSARVAEREALEALIGAHFAHHERATLAARLQAAGIAWARLRTLDELARHPFLRQTQARIGAAEIDVAALPVRSARAHGTAPLLGAHSAAIREEFAP